MTIRNTFIDFLRGLAIIVMILIHTTSFFPSDKLATSIWNWSQFAVPVFVFCSGYLFFKKQFQHKQYILLYVKKRIPRFLIPYYIFLPFFLLAVFFLNSKLITGKYILQSIFIIGGVDINWLVLLFLYFTFLLPLIVLLYQRYKVGFWFFFLISAGSSIVFLFYHPPVSYKLIMWIPWTTILFFSFWYMRFEQHKKARILLLSGLLLVYIISYYIQTIFHHDLVLRNNKYPPNIYFLSYGMVCIVLLSFILPYFFKNKRVSLILHFFSFYSYQIYFLHYVLLTVFSFQIAKYHLNWVTFSLIVLSTTVLTQLLWNWIRVHLAPRI